MIKQMDPKAIAAFEEVVREHAETENKEIHAFIRFIQSITKEVITEIGCAYAGILYRITTVDGQYVLAQMDAIDSGKKPQTFMTPTICIMDQNDSDNNVHCHGKLIPADSTYSLQLYVTWQGVLKPLLQVKRTNDPLMHKLELCDLSMFNFKE